MPEKRLQKTRETLPEGYQFGDAQMPKIRIRFIKSWDIKIDTEPPRRMQFDLKGWNG